MSGIEKVPQIKDVYEYPTLGAEISGAVSKQQLENELIPHIVQILIDSGETEIQAKSRVDKSLGELVRSQNIETEQAQEWLRTILHNMNEELRVQRKNKSKATPSSLSAAAVPPPHGIAMTKNRPTVSLDEVRWRKNIVLQEEQADEKFDENEDDFLNDIRKKESIKKSQQSGLADWKEQTLDWNDLNRSVLSKEKKDIEPEEGKSNQGDVNGEMEDNITNATVEDNNAHIAAFNKEKEFRGERIERTKRQLDLTRDTAYEIRKTTGLTDKEALKQNNDFKTLRNRVRLLRYQLKRLTQGEVTDDSHTKIQKLRDEIAHAFKSYRKSVADDRGLESGGEEVVTEVAQAEEVEDGMQVNSYPRFRIVDEPKKAFGLPVQPRVRREDIKPSNSTSEFLSVVPDRTLALSETIRLWKDKIPNQEKSFTSIKRSLFCERLKTVFSLKKLKQQSKLALVLPLLLTLGSDSLQNDSKSTSGFGNTISKINDVVGTKGDFLGRLGGSSVVFKTPLFETKISPKGDLEVKPKQISDRVSPSAEEQVSPKSDLTAFEKTVEQIPAVKDSVPQVPEEDSNVAPSLNYTFIPGDKINTVSEALCSLIEKNPELISGDMTPGEAVRDFNHEIEHLKQDNPDYYYDLLDQMGVTSGNIDEVGAGKTYNFTPLFEYLNSLPE